MVVSPLRGLPLQLRAHAATRMAPEAVPCDALVTRARKLARALLRSHYALPASAAAAPWRVRAAGLVQAAHMPVCSLIPLSIVDTELYMIGGPCSGTLFFRTALDCEALRATLSQALDAFPILAGRVVSLPAAASGAGTAARQTRTGEWRRGYPRAVDCNNAGAAFTVLDLPGVALPEDRNSWMPRAELRAISAGLHLKDMTDDPDAVILDVLQVNYATGCMVTVSASHAVVDGASAAAFMHHWSSLLSGVPQEDLPNPLLDRVAYDLACGASGQVCLARQAAEAAKARQAAKAQQPPGCCGGSRAAAADDAPVATEEADAPSAAGAAVAAAPDVSPASPSPRPPRTGKPASLPDTSPMGGMTVWPSAGGWARMLVRIVTDSSLGMAPGRCAAMRMVLPFPTAELARLKAAAAAGAAAAGRAEEAARLSTNDALCAAVWLALERARRRRGAFDLTGSCPATFSFVANTRGLVLPRAQQCFIGNATVILQASLPPDQLRSGSLADVASVLRHAKAALTPEAVRAEMQFLQAHADSGARNIRWNSLTLDGGQAMWDWTKFPIYDLKFTGGIRPFWFEPGLGAPMLLPYICGAAPAPDGDGLLVFANVPKDECESVLAELRKVA